MEAICYLRISKDSTKQDLGRQLKPIKEFCKNKGFKLNEKNIFQDEISGSIKAQDRKGYKKLLECLETLDNQPVLIFDEVSRLGRSQLDILNEIDFLKTKTKNIYFLNPECAVYDELGNKSEITGIIISLFSQFAETERDRIISRIKSAVSRTAEKGKTLGGNNLPFGYEVVNKYFKVCDNEADIVRYIFNMYVEGSGAMVISKWLNTKNIRTKLNNKFTANSLMKLLKNPMYKGVRVVNEIEYPFPAIISEEVWDSVQLLRLNKVNTRKRVRKNINPFVGIAKCACGSPLYVSNSKYKLIYGCDNSLKNGTKFCGYMNTIDYDLLNNSILTMFKKIYNNYNVNIEVVDVLNKKINNIKNIHIPNYNDELKGFKNKTERLNDLFIDGKISRLKYDERNEQFKKDELKIVSEIEKGKKRVKDIEQQINLLNDNKPTDGIFEMDKFNMFSQKNIKSIIVKKQEVDNIFFKKYYKEKQQIVYKVEVETNLDMKFMFYIGNRNRLMISRMSDNQKIYNKVDGEYTFDIDDVKMFEEIKPSGKVGYLFGRVKDYMNTRFNN